MKNKICKCKPKTNREDKLQGIMSSDRVMMWTFCDDDDDNAEYITLPSFTSLGKYKRTGMISDCENKMGGENIWTPTKKTRISLELIQRGLKTLKGFGMAKSTAKILDFVVYEGVKGKGKKEEIIEGYPIVIKWLYSEYGFVIAPRVDGE